MKRALFYLLAMLMCGAVWAVPARRVWQQVLLPDGTTVEVMQVGDEHLHYYVTADGTTLQQDNDGAFRPFSPDKLASRRALRTNQFRQRRAARRQVTSYTGSKRALIILVSFSDLDFTVSDAQTLWDGIVNGTGAAVYGAPGSVSDYFSAQSGGVFQLSFDVVGPVKMPNSYRYYGTNDADGNDAHVDELVYTACQQVDGDVNFADYDWYGDGSVDQVFVLYAGRGENDGGGATTIWPHQWALSDYGSTYSDLTLDGVRIDTYACSNEVTRNAKLAGIGTFCHEFSHCLGLPDMYNTNGGGSVLGDWDLMDNGCYNGASWVPCGYSAFERFSVGWLTPTELTEPVTIDGLRALGDGGEAYWVLNSGNANEYYLLENRQLTGWDAALPAGGLLITHVDYDEQAWYDNEPNNVSNHLRVGIVAADNRSAAVSTSHATYPYNDNAALTDTSQPAAKWFTADAGGSKLVGKPITDINISADAQASFRFCGGATAVSGVRGATAADVLGIFDVRGQCVGNVTRHGIYIIRYSDGTSRKLIH